MRILIASDTYPPDINGASIFASRLGARLATEGHEVHHVAPGAGPASPVNPIQAAVGLTRVSSFTYPWASDFRIANPFWVRQEVQKAVARFKPDVVHAQAHFVVGRAAISVARRHHLPVVATNHFMPENLVPQLPVYLTDRVTRSLEHIAWSDAAAVLRTVDVLTSPTQFAADLLSRKTGIVGVRVVSNGVSIARPPVRPDSRPPTALFVGRLDPEKRVEDLLAAAALLPNIRFLIVGRGSAERTLRHFAQVKGLENRVFFLGALSDDLLQQQFETATVFCMPGRAELQSIACLEAMATGLPVVASRSGALPELVRDGVNGFLYEPGNAADLGRRLREATNSAAVTKALSSGALKTAGVHEISKTVRSFEAIYREVVRSRPKLQVPR